MLEAQIKKKPGKHFFWGEKLKLVKQGHFEVLQKDQVCNMPRAVWAGESKNDLRIEINEVPSSNRWAIQLY